MNIIPYLDFYGNCEEALERYKSIFNGEITYIQRYSDAPNMNVPESYMDRILHARLLIGNQLFYFSDNLPGTTEIDGSRVALSIAFDSPDELKRVFHELEKNGRITMALEEQFWGALFGSLVDEFGIPWSLNCELKK